MIRMLPQIVCFCTFNKILGKGQGEDNRRRLQKEVEQLRKDYEIACQQNGELFDLADDGEYDTIDKWENDLTNDIFSIEEKVESLLNPSADQSHASPPGKLTSPVPNKTVSAKNTGQANCQIIKTKLAIHRTHQRSMHKIKHLQVSCQLWKMTPEVTQATRKLVTVRQMGLNK